MKMVNEAPTDAAAPAAAPQLENYVQVALSIGEQPIRSRAGFGAFRHFHDVCRNSIALAVESGFFAGSVERITSLPFIDEELLFYLSKGRWRYQPKHRHFFERVLSTPSSFSPTCLWSLFWAVAQAEHEFMARYVPYWSHEERLPVHLVAQLLNRLEDFAPYWAALDGSGQPEDRAHCRIHYVDTATARRESLTGADLGLIVQVRLPRQQEYFKAARFQAKKAGKTGKAQIDLTQAETLLEKEGLGYYLIYHYLDPQRWTLPPTVLSANYFEHNVEAQRKNKPTQKELGTEYIGVTSSGYDFATFITFALADQASDHGLFAPTAEDAVRALMATNLALPQLSRVVVVTLGAQATDVNWDRLFVEYIGRGDLQ